MSITKYGADVCIKAIVLLALIGGTVFFFVSAPLIRYPIVGLSLIAAMLVLNFFRDPDRTIPSDKYSILSPADGTVVVIKEVSEPEFIKGNALQVSIFMSPLNVHVNRFPLSGTVRYFKHVQGEYLVAFDDKSSERNERTLIGIQNGNYKVLFKQIAGTVARRIVAPVSEGQPAVAGERFGMIRFGSRVDVLMPKGTTVKVHLREKVVAGETILAEYASSTTSFEQHRKENVVV